ncbi:hypothetical protein [Aquiluna sp. Uisw_065]|jgi:predicted RNA methylase|uniref:hypothetical protein n=1 Tax=Aquiluna sp. Uisw_065 TaxID=3230967 RepID=UPI0039ECFEF5
MTKKLGNRRVSGTEQYYTPKDLAGELVELTLRTISRATEKSFLEPAGGTGSFIEALNRAGITAITSVDKYPMHPSVIQADFLEWETKRTDLLTISNPPFGRNNALSVPFFNRAAEFSSQIAFLVPRSWRKWSVQNRLDSRFHLVLDVDIAVQYEDAFGEKIAKRNDLRTCFQIWEKRLDLRATIAVPDNGFIQKTTPDNADLAIRVFGYGCGNVMSDFPRQPNTTLMFLRVLDKSIKSALLDLDYERFSINTAYTRALSFQEINFLINERVFGDGFHEKLGL